MLGIHENFNELQVSKDSDKSIEIPDFPSEVNNFELSLNNINMSSTDLNQGFVDENQSINDSIQKSKKQFGFNLNICGMSSLEDPIDIIEIKKSNLFHSNSSTKPNTNKKAQSLKNTD